MGLKIPDREWDKAQHNLNSFQYLSTDKSTERKVLALKMFTQFMLSLQIALHG